MSLVHLSTNSLNCSLTNTVAQSHTDSCNQSFDHTVGCLIASLGERNRFWVSIYMALWKQCVIARVVSFYSPKPSALCFFVNSLMEDFGSITRYVQIYSFRQIAFEYFCNLHRLAV